MSNAKIYNRTCFFNLPIAGMSHFVSKCQFLQYVDDTAIYTHCKIKNLKVAEQNPETELNELLTWYNETNLVFNSTKAKVMLIAIHIILSNAKIYSRTCFFNLPIAGMSHFV